MTDWSTLRITFWLPVGAELVAALLLYWVWASRQGLPFSDTRLIDLTATRLRLRDRFLIISGLLITVLLSAALTHPAVVQVLDVEREARDFLLVVDTSSSMARTTPIRRETIDMHFNPQATTYVPRLKDTDPVARFELARESLYHFVSERRPEDRIALVYFNDEAYTMAGFTTNANFVTDQLAAMERYMGGGTNLSHGLETGLGLLESHPSASQKAVVLLTDAEVWQSDDLDRQLELLRGPGITLFLLWIMPSQTVMSISDQAKRFLEFVENNGTIFEIKNLDADSLNQAFGEIGRLPAFRYRVERHRRLDLAPALMDIVRLGLPLWLFLVMTVCHPRGTAETFLPNSRRHHATRR